jgi:hypothetical protein
MKYFAALLLIASVCFGCGAKDDGEIPDITKAAQNPETNTIEATPANAGGGAPPVGTGAVRSFGHKGK